MAIGRKIWTVSLTSMDFQVVPVMKTNTNFYFIIYLAMMLNIITSQNKTKFVNPCCMVHMAGEREREPDIFVGGGVMMREGD